MLDLGTVVQVVELVRGAIEIYERIKDGPEAMAKIDRRMRRLEALLTHLENHLRSRSKHALARLHKTQTEELLIIVKETHEDAGKVHTLFYKWDNQIGPWGLQFRFKTIAQAYFLLGTNSDKLEGLAADIETHRKDIDTYIGLIGIAGVQAGFSGIQEIRKENEVMKKQLESLVRMAKTPKVQEPPAAPAAIQTPDDLQQLRRENKAIRKQLDTLLKIMENASQPQLVSPPLVVTEPAKPSGGSKPAASNSQKPKSDTVTKDTSKAPDKSKPAADELKVKKDSAKHSSSKENLKDDSKSDAGTKDPSKFSDKIKAAVDEVKAKKDPAKHSSAKEKPAKPSSDANPKNEKPTEKPKEESKDKPRAKSQDNTHDKKAPNPKPRTKSDAKKPPLIIQDTKDLALHPKPKPPPSPSPLPPRTDYSIIFIDPNNQGRSVVAAATVHLLRHWTLSTGGTWRVGSASSAGFYVRNEAPGLTSCTDEITALLSRAKSSYRIPINGPKMPDASAVAALFDNSAYSFLGDKAEMKAAVESRKARGIERDIFRANDYIVVFTSREHENMLALRKELVEKEGKAAAPRGKGRILLLGHYLRRKDGTAREILNPGNGKGDLRERWNVTMGEIKTAVKRMLKDEFGWVQPEGKAL